MDSTRQGKLEQKRVRITKKHTARSSDSRAIIQKKHSNRTQGRISGLLMKWPASQSRTEGCDEGEGVVSANVTSRARRSKCFSTIRPKNPLFADVHVNGAFAGLESTLRRPAGPNRRNQYMTPTGALKTKTKNTVKIRTNSETRLMQKNYEWERRKPGTSHLSEISTNSLKQEMKQHRNKSLDRERRELFVTQTR